MSYSNCSKPVTKENLKKVPENKKKHYIQRSKQTFKLSGQKTIKPVFKVQKEKNVNCEFYTQKNYLSKMKVKRRLSQTSNS